MLILVAFDVVFKIKHWGKRLLVGKYVAKKQQTGKTKLVSLSADSQGGKTVRESELVVIVWF